MGLGLMETINITVPPTLQGTQQPSLTPHGGATVPGLGPTSQLKPSREAAGSHNQVPLSTPGVSQSLFPSLVWNYPNRGRRI